MAAQVIIAVASAVINAGLTYYLSKREQDKADRERRRQERKNNLEGWSKARPEAVRDNTYAPLIFGTRIIEGKAFLYNSQEVVSPPKDAKPQDRDYFLAAAKPENLSHPLPLADATNSDNLKGYSVFRALTGYVLSAPVDRVNGVLLDPTFCPTYTQGQEITYPPMGQTGWSTPNQKNLMKEYQWAWRKKLGTPDVENSPIASKIKQNYGRTAHTLSGQLSYGDVTIPIYTQFAFGKTDSQRVSSAEWSLPKYAPPSYKGYACAWVYGSRQVFSYQPQSYFFEVERKAVVPVELQPYAEISLEREGISFNTRTDKATFHLGKATNPACAIYELLTSTEFGLGLPPSFIDLDSFIGASQRLFNDGEGYDIEYDKGEPKALINEIVDLVDGILFMDRLTGLFVFELFRYGDSTIKQIRDEDIINASSITKAMDFDTPSGIVFNYAWPHGGERVLRYTNAERKSFDVELDFPFITESSVAQLVGARKYTTITTPALRGQLVVHGRSAADLNLGSLFRLNSNTIGADIDCRVIEIDQSPYADGAVTIKFVQNVWGQRPAFKLRPFESITSRGLPVAPVGVLSFEPSYFELSLHYGVDRMGDPLIGDGLYPDGSFRGYTPHIAVSALPGNSKQTSFRLFTCANDCAGWLGMVDSGDLADFNYSTTITFAPYTRYDTTITATTQGLAVGQVWYLGEELIEVVALSANGLVATVRRGLADTVPYASSLSSTGRLVSANSQPFFGVDFSVFADWDSTTRQVTGESTIKAFVVPRANLLGGQYGQTSSEFTQIAPTRETPAMNTLARFFPRHSRANRPTRVAVNSQVLGQSFYGDIVITFGHSARFRLVPSDFYSSGDIMVRAGTSGGVPDVAYDVFVYPLDFPSGVMYERVAIPVGDTTGQATFTTAEEIGLFGALSTDYRVEVFGVINDVTFGIDNFGSWQKVIFNTTRSAEPLEGGWGFDYDLDWGS